MKQNTLAVLLLSCLTLSCGPLTDFRELLEPDLVPPCLIGVRSMNSTEIELEFDEIPVSQPDWLKLHPDGNIRSLSRKDSSLIVLVDQQHPGQEYILEAVVEDKRGNRLSFLTTIYGYNPDTPRVLINEFTTRGTGNHPDVLELKVLNDGNMGGMSLYQGTPNNWRDRLIFPDFQVKAGDFILVHFKTSADLEELDETGAKDSSGGLDSSDNAFDFWIKDGSGISGNNGVLSIYDRPGGLLLDGVLYSNRSSDSDERYDGFGTLDTLERARQLVADMGWVIGGEKVRPEDAVSPEGSTGTRSLCRSSSSADTDTLLDWHIVPTRGATFGEENSDEVYAP